MCSSRNSRPEVFYKKRVLNKFTGKHLCWSLFSDKAAGWRPETLLKSDFSTGQFLCILKNTLWCEFGWYFVFVLVDIFLLLLLMVVLPYEILDKIFVNPTECRWKPVSTLLAAIFMNVSLRFTISRIRQKS